MQARAHCESRPTCMAGAYLSIAIRQTGCWYPYLHVACTVSASHDTAYTSE